MPLLTSILKGKCPNCKKGDIFPSMHPFKGLEMNSRCDECGCKFENEPGFYYGAMYMSYGVSLAISAPIALAGFLYMDEPNPFIIGAMIGGVMLLTAITIFKYSRILWIYLFA